MMLHLGRFNEQYRFCLHNFCTPSVEGLPYAVQIHSMLPTTLSLGDAYVSHLNDRFPRALDNLRIRASLGYGLVACHINFTNAFWSLILYRKVYRIVCMFTLKA